MVLKNYNKRQIASTWVILLMCLLHQLTQNSMVKDESNFIVFKNDKIFVLGFQTQIPQQTEGQDQKVTIVNNQQILKIQVASQNSNNLEKHAVANLTQYLPIFSSYLAQKGYLRPADPFASSQDEKQFVKGYKYRKPAYHNSEDQTFAQMEAFLKALIQSNNLSYLNLRMEDSFEIQVRLNPSKPTPIIRSIKVKYLFATVERESIPIETLNILSSNIQSYDNYLANQKIGTIERKLSGKGLHQWVKLTVDLDDVTDILLEPTRQKCFLEFTDVLPESTYIDADQRRKQTTNYEIINVQKPAFAAKQYFYKYRVPLTELQESGVHRYSYKQPIHFRYPAASLLNYTKVYLHPIEQVRIVCDQNPSQSLQENASQAIYALEENLLFDRGTAKLPNADISKQKFVSIATLAVCLVTVLIIVNKLKKN